MDNTEFFRWAMQRWCEKVLKSYVKRLLFVDKERVGKTGREMKVKTFFSVFTYDLETIL